jgi:subtilisin-like proprotein convertase family protein
MIRYILCIFVASLVPCYSYIQAQNWQEKPCSAYGANCRDVVPDAHKTVPGAVSSTITIPAGAGTATAPALIAAVRARVKLIHTRLGDVTLTLRGPDGATVSLPTIYSGTRQDIDAIYNGLDNSFPETHGDDIPALTGSVRQQDIVSWHGGTSVAGDWTLTVTDSAHLNYGALDGWSLDFYTSPPYVWITATVPEATEAPYVAGEFTVTRAIVTTSPLTVFLTINGTANAGHDYESISLPVTIPAYQASQTITVSPQVFESINGSRTVIATLGTGAGYLIGGGAGPTTATVTITDGAEQDLQVQQIPLLGPWQMALMALLLAGTGVFAARLRVRNPFCE